MSGMMGVSWYPPKISGLPASAPCSWITCSIAQGHPASSWQFHRFHPAQPAVSWTTSSSFPFPCPRAILWWASSVPGPLGWKCSWWMKIAAHCCRESCRQQSSWHIWSLDPAKRLQAASSWSPQRVFSALGWSLVQWQVGVPGAEGDKKRDVEITSLLWLSFPSSLTSPTWQFRHVYIKHTRTYIHTYIYIYTCIIMYVCNVM